MSEGYSWREQRRKELTAWKIHWFMTGLIGKDAPTVDQLMGRVSLEEGSSEEEIQEFSSVLRGLNGDRGNHWMD